MYDDAGSDPSNLDSDSDVTFNHAAAHASIFKSAVASVGKFCLVFVPLLFSITITLYSFFPSRFLTLTLTSSIDSRARSPGFMRIRRHARSLWPFKRT